MLATKIVLFFFIIGSLFFSYGQNRNELESERQRINREIALTNELLQETKKSAKTSINRLVILNNQIEKRKTLLNNIRSEITIINQQVESYEKEIDILNTELEELKESYANMIYHAYKNRSSYDRLMFIFAAKDFNQAYMRIRYMQQYSHHRKLQAERIEDAANKLDEKIAKLEERKIEQQIYLTQHQNELNILTAEKVEQNRTVHSLRQKEQSLLAQLKQKEKEANELSRAIERIIEEERRRAAEKARAEGRATPDRVFELTPEERIISDNFYENKGKLPWPSERGVITRHFGEQDHPVLPGIRISNDGVNISTTKGAMARAIFEGTVVRVFTQPRGDNAVIIRHGEYLTVYSNLTEVIVRNGQRVEIRQEIGVISTDPRENETELQLQIWKGNKKLNPTEWIARRQ